MRLHSSRIVSYGLCLLPAICGILTARADYQGTVLSQSPQGYWRLNETAAPPPPNAPNLGSLGAAGNGSVAAGVLRGEPGALASSDTAYRFTNPGWGITYFGPTVDVPYNAALNPSGAFTIEIWAKPSSQAPDLFSPVCSLDASQNSGNSREGYLIYYDGATSKWNFRVGAASGYAATIEGGTVTPNQWHHVVGVYSGSSVTLYVNGVQANTGAAGTFTPNGTQPFRIGATTIPNRTFDGWVDEVAFYNGALNAATVKAHYDAATTNGPGYATQILASSPVGYWRLGESADPVAVNAGTLGAAANAKYFAPSAPGQTGPTPATFPGFESGNKAVGFPGTGGTVQIPSLNFSNNFVTFTTWVKPNGGQANDAGIVFNRGQFGAGGTYHSSGGLKMDVLGGLNLAYAWDGDPEPAGWDSGVSMNDGQWNFVALIVRPDRAVLWVPQGPNPSPATNMANHGVLLFDSTTYIGTDPYTNVTSAFRAFNGTIDEVAMFNRALSLGEVYSQYAAAVGGIAPSIFADPQAPAGTLYAGDALQLTVDAGGTPNLAYQWRKNSLPIGGATASSYTVASAALTDSGTYDVIISNSSGSSNSASAVVTVSPQASPTFTQNLTIGTRAIFAGGTIKLQVAAVGGGVTYQWKKNGSNISGQTGSSLTITGITAADAASYTVAASNGAGNQTSAAEAITVPTPAAGSYEANISTDHPISWYRMDDPVSSPNMLDSMGRWDGFWTNMVSPVTLGVPGALTNSPSTAAHFAFANQSWGEVPTLPPPVTTGDITYECWVRTTDTTDNLSPLSTFKSQNQYGFFVRKTPSGTDAPAGAWRACSGYGELDGFPFRNGAPAALQANQWTHLVTTFSAAVGQKSYVNGVWDGQGPFVDFSREFNTPLRVGVAGPNTGELGYWYDGDVDEVAVYNYALSDAQILAHYQSAQFVAVKPFFTQLPASQTIVSNSAATVSFVGLAQGSSPITYQWSKNGNPIAGATNTVLTLAGAYSNAALYTLTANNPVGSSNANASFSIIPAGPPFANVTNNLVLHLKFDGNYADSSGRGNNATAVGSPTIVPGRLGSGALEFSSDNSASFNYLTLGNPADLQFGANTSFSVAYWVKIPFSGGFPATNGDLPFLCSATGSYGNQGITFAPSYKLGGWSYSMNGIVQLYGPNNSINDGNWHHLVHSFDRTGFAVTWLDGVQVDSRLMTGAGNLDNTGPINIGQDPTGTYPEIGVDDLDDVAIWRRPLSAYEAYAIYYMATNSNTSFDTAGPVSLKIATVGSNIQISWRPGSSLGTLLQADQVTGPWTPVGVYVPVYQVAPGAAKKFYRVQLN